MTNPDRTVILDLAAIEAARGPQPNDYFLCLTKREAAMVCYATAYLLSKEVCEVEDCANCNRYRRLFWDCANQLTLSLQGSVFLTLDEAGIEVPLGPWEEEKR